MSTPFPLRLSSSLIPADSEIFDESVGHFFHTLLVTNRKSLVTLQTSYFLMNRCFNDITEEAYHSWEGQSYCGVVGEMFLRGREKKKSRKGFLLFYFVTLSFLSYLNMASSLDVFLIFQFVDLPLSIAPLSGVITISNPRTPLLNLRRNSLAAHIFAKINRH